MKKILKEVLKLTLADFTVLDKDIMMIEEDEILNTNIEMTIIGGKVVYKRN